MRKCETLRSIQASQSCAHFDLNLLSETIQQFLILGHGSASHSLDC